MHPYHVFHHRGPSRVLWFLFGVGAATWWHSACLMRDRRALTYHRRPPLLESPARDSEQDLERFTHLQKRAGETVAELSESTLDSIISGAESLKAKLMQLRAERERLEAEKKAPAQSAV